MSNRQALRRRTDLARAVRRWELPARKGESGLLVSIAARSALGDATGEVNRSMDSGSPEVVEIVEDHSVSNGLLQAHTAKGSVPLDPFAPFTTGSFDVADHRLMVVEMTIGGFFGASLTRWNVLRGDQLLASAPPSFPMPRSIINAFVGRIGLSYSGFMRARAGLMDWRAVAADGGSVDASLPDLIAILGAGYALPKLDPEVVGVVTLASELVTSVVDRDPLPPTDLRELLDDWPDLGPAWRVTLVETAGRQRWHTIVELWSGTARNENPSMFPVSGPMAAFDAMPERAPLTVAALPLGGDVEVLWEGTKPELPSWLSIVERFAN